MPIPKKIFIVPYRDRELQKIHFEVYMKYLMEDIPSDDYEIYFSHQQDTLPFNRGAIKNIGFLAMKAKYPDDYKNITFIFNDIDTMPYKKDQLLYDTNTGIIKHFYGFNYALGGIFSITGGDFEKCDGFPNFWGYGLEDNLMQNRVLAHKLLINRSNFFIMQSPHFLQINETGNRLVSNRTHDLKKKLYTDGLKDVKNLKYQIEGQMINVTGFDVPEKYNDDQYFVQNFAEDSRLINNRLQKLELQKKRNHFKLNLGF
jgi:hypothetical protein